MAYKVFQNGYPLTASELNNYLMNQTVMVFASSAERASVLTAPVEGMVTWLQDTNVFQVRNGSGAWVDVTSDAIPKSVLTTTGDLIVADGSASVTRLGIGTTGQVLSSNGTTATWSTPSSPVKNWVSLGTATLTGAQTVTLSGIGGYQDLAIFVENASSVSTGSAMTIRFNGDTTSSYVYNRSDVLSGGTYSTNNLYSVSGTGTSFALAQMSNNASSVVNGRMIVSGVSASGVKLVNYSGSGTPAGSNSHMQFIGQGYWNNAAAITSVSVFSDIGNLDAGTLRVLGA